MEDFFKVLGIIGAIILALFIEPFLIFWLCYFGGWIAKIVIGKWIIAGLALLNIYIEPNQIPLLAGILGWIGGFFKNSNIKYNTDK